MQELNLSLQDANYFSCKSAQHNTPNSTSSLRIFCANPRNSAGNKNFPVKASLCQMKIVDLRSRTSPYVLFLVHSSQIKLFAFKNFR